MLLKREMSVVALASLFFLSFAADERMFTDLLITSLIGGFFSTNLNFLSTLLVLETDGDRSSTPCDIENSACLLDPLLVTVESPLQWWLWRSIQSGTPPMNWPASSHSWLGSISIRSLIFVVRLVPHVILCTASIRFERPAQRTRHCSTHFKVMCSALVVGEDVDLWAIWTAAWQIQKIKRMQIICKDLNLGKLCWDYSPHPWFWCARRMILSSAIVLFWLITCLSFIRWM